MKKNSIINQAESARKSLVERGKQLDSKLFVIKEFKQSVIYKKKRKIQKFRGLWKLAQ